MAATAPTRWERLAAAGGIAFVVLQLASQGLIQIGGAEPSFGAPADEIVEFFEARNQTLFAVGSYLLAISFIPFIWFLGALWAGLRRVAEGGAWLGVVAVGSGLLFLASVSGGWHLAMFRIDEGLDPQLARFAFDMGNFGFASSWMPLASMVLAVTVAAWDGPLLPRWLNVLGIVTAVGLLVSRAIWTSAAAFLPYGLLWVWLIATSVLLMRRAPRQVET